MVNLLQTLRSRVGRSLAYGRQPTPRPRPYQEMGVSGTAVYGGYVQVKERSPEWIGRQKWITASDLAVNTSIVAAGVHYFLNLVAYPKWTIRPSDDKDEESLALAEFTDHVINNMDSPWYKVVRRAAMYRFYGFGVQEWTAKHRDDGLVGLKDIESRPAHTIEQWDVDIDGVVLGMWQRSPQTGHMLGLPRDKVLYLVEDTLTDNPEGIGMFRHLADPYKRLKQLQELEIRAYERDLRGIPIARAPLTFINRAIKAGTITQAEANSVLNEMRSMVELQVKQSDTGLVLDSLPYFSDSDSGDQVSALPQWGFELLSGAGVGHAEIAAAIDRVQREMARIIGVEHLMMGDVGGNRSLSEDKSRNLYLIANSVLKYIASQVRRDVVTPLWRLNGFPKDKMPKVETEDVTFKNADAITGALHRLATAGAPLAPNDPVINDIRDLLGITRVPDDIMAQGAAQPNPALANLPPELQLAMMGGKGGSGIQLPGKTTGLGAGGPGKQPGKGGGALPGTGGFDPTKKAKGYLAEQLGVEEDDEPLGELEEPTEPTRNGFAVAQPKRVKPNGRPVIERERLNEGEEAPGIDIKGSGKVEVDSGLLVRLLERFAGGPVEGQPPALGAPAKPTEDSLAAAKPGEGENEDDPTAEAAGKPGKGPAPDAKPKDGEVGKPEVGKPGPGKGDKPSAAGKPEVDPKTGQPVEPQIDPKTGLPMEPQPGMPGAMPPKPKQQEMDIGRAAGILQPYAGGNPSPGIDHTEAKTESDELYTRLGEEKDVEPVTTALDPNAEVDEGGNPVEVPMEEGVIDDKPVVDPKTGKPVMGKPVVGRPMAKPVEEEELVDDSLGEEGLAEEQLAGGLDDGKPKVDVEALRALLGQEGAVGQAKPGLAAAQPQPLPKRLVGRSLPMADEDGEEPPSRKRPIKPRSRARSFKSVLKGK